MKKHLIWDFDGTLYDTYAYLVKWYTDFIRIYDPNVSAQKVEQILRLESSVELMRYYPIDFDEAKRYLHLQQEQSFHLIQPMPYIPEVLKQSIQMGVKHYIFTNRSIASTQQFLIKDHLERDFVEIVGQENGFLRKPSGQGITYLMDRYQLPPDQCLMIGDRSIDMDAAKDAGIEGALLYAYDQQLQGTYTWNDARQLFTIIG